MSANKIYAAEDMVDCAVLDSRMVKNLFLKSLLSQMRWSILVAPHKFLLSSGYSAFFKKSPIGEYFLKSRLLCGFWILIV